MVVKTIYVNGRKINITDDIKPSGTYYRARITTQYDPVTKKQKQKTISGNSVESVVDQIYILLNPRLAAPKFQQVRISMSDAVNDYIERHYRDGNSRSYAAQKSRLKQIITPAIGSKQFESFTQQEAQAFVSLISKYYAAATVAATARLISRCYDGYVQRGELPYNPLMDVSLPKPPDSKGVVLTEKELLRLLEALQKTPYYLFFNVCALMTLRIGECRGLAWNKINWEKKQITIDQQIPITAKNLEQSLKNSNPTTLYYADDVFEALDAQRNIQNAWKEAAGEKWSNPNDLVFTDQFGHFIPQGRLYKSFNQSKLEAGIPHFRIHDFRHTMASYLWESTHNIDKVRIILRHKTIATTRIYIHTTEKTKLECKTLMDQVSKKLMHPEITDKAK